MRALARSNAGIKPRPTVVATAREMAGIVVGVHHGRRRSSGTCRIDEAQREQAS